MNTPQQIKISVVVAVRNNPQVYRNIEAFFSSDYRDKELVVVDDFSDDNTLSVLCKYDNVKLINLTSHHGPSMARNKGAEAAEGNVLFFMDSDTILYRDTLSKVASFLKTHPECHGLTAIYDAEPLDETFFSKLKAIEMNSMFIHYFNWSFGSNGSAIYKDIFFNLGGFSPAFKKADAEDFELGLRVLGTGINIPVRNDIKIRHGFLPTFKQGLLKYFRRAYLRSAVLKDYRKNALKIPTTSYNSKKVIIMYLSSLAFLFSSIITLAFLAAGIENLILVAGMISFAFLLVWFLAVRHILLAFYKKGGFLFFLRALPVYFLLTLAISAGGILGQILKPKEGASLRTRCAVK